MIAYATAISDREVYERVALPGIERVATENSVMLTREGYDSVARPYNEMMEEAGALEGLEALVLIHQDLELTDGSLPERVASLLRDSRTGLVGALGARDVRLHCWTDSREHLYGTAMAPGVAVRFSTGPHEVDIVDGALLVVAPWAVRSLRFDEVAAGTFHGYDVDFSCRVRASGGRVVCDDIPYFHRMARSWDGDDALTRAGVALARRWDPALRPSDWAPAFRR